MTFMLVFMLCLWTEMGKRSERQKAIGTITETRSVGRLSA